MWNGFEMLNFVKQQNYILKYIFQTVEGVNGKENMIFASYTTGSVWTTWKKFYMCLFFIQPPYFLKSTIFQQVGYRYSKNSLWNLDVIARAYDCQNNFVKERSMANITVFHNLLESYRNHNTMALLR